MSRSSLHKSEAFYSRTVCKDGGACTVIENGDDLDPFPVGLGRGDWGCGGGRLTGNIFHFNLWLARVAKKNTSTLSDVVSMYLSSSVVLSPPYK